MKVRFWTILSTIALICFLALGALAIPSFFDPAFEVVNNASRTVKVTASWREKNMDLGNIPPDTTYEFDVDDEAAMVFRVYYGNGDVNESEPIYFSRGIKVITSIYDDRVEVRYDFEA